MIGLWNEKKKTRWEKRWFNCLLLLFWIWGCQLHVIRKSKFAFLGFIHYFLKVGKKEKMSGQTSANVGKIDGIIVLFIFIINFELGGVANSRKVSFLA